MDLISRHSPSSSVSPPISPIKVFSQPATSLPPLKNLPVWNRTGLDKNRFLRSITKDSPENTKTDFLFSHLTSKSTQTSPPSTAFGSISNYHSNELRREGRTVNDGAAPVVADKKLYFLQAEHEGVLKKLHLELESLRNKNREMTFKLIMTNNGSSVSADGKDLNEFNQGQESSKYSHQTSSNRRNSADKGVDQGRDRGFKDDARRQKSSFRSAGNKSSHSTTEPDGKPNTRSAKYNIIDQKKGYLRNRTDNSIEQQAPNSQEISDVQHASHMAQVDPSGQATTSSTIAGKQYSPKDYEEIIKDLKKLNAKQATELSHLKEKLLEQKERHDDLQFGSPSRLPKLDVRNTSKSAKIHTGIRGRHEIVALPALRPILGTKVTNRQRKAQASHVQRQRSNKDIIQKIV